MHFDDRMDGSQGIGAIGANNSSDFVSWFPLPLSQYADYEIDQIMFRSESSTSRNFHRMYGKVC